MAAEIRPRGRFHWRWPWLLAALTAVVVIAGAFGVGIASGFFGRIGQPGPPATSTPSPGTSPSPSGTPSASVVAGLRGKIAIDAAPSPGWISFPGGTFTADPSSNVALATGGAYGHTHVLALNRWVPVPRDWVSPDGLKYAYFADSQIHVARAGQSELVLRPPAPGGGQMMGRYVLATENTGVYVEPAPGLWWIPFSGPPRQVIDSGIWTATDGRYAYGSLTWSEGKPNPILRLDLRDGSMTTVVPESQALPFAVGVDADGNAVVVSYDAPAPTVAQVWLVGSGSTKMIYQTTIKPSEYFSVTSVVPDTMGTWISTSKGLFLYSHQAGLELASTAGIGALASAFRG